MPTRYTTRILATLGVAALIALSPSALADSGTQTEAPRYPQAELDDLRLQLDDLRATFLAIAEDTSPEMHDALTRRFDVFETLSDEDLADLKDTGVDLDLLIESGLDLQEINESFRENARLGTLEKSGGLPGAPYSSVCGSRRNSVPAMFAAGRALEVAEGVFSIADRACNQVAVAAGFGGNTSAACIVADTALSAARYVFETFAFCDRDIDSAETAGAYARLGHLHGDLSSLDTKVDANTSSIIANGNANRAQVITNDNANRDILFGQAEANTNKLIAKTQMLADQGKSREVENFLRMRECTAWMYTPASLGGQAEFVLEVVEDVVDDARALGSVDATRLASAESALATARALGRRLPLDAANVCRALFLAYADATPSAVNRVPVSGRR